MIPYGKHIIDEQDVNAVVDVLENHFLTQGSKVPAFEKDLCQYTKADYCTTVNSATSGLHVACLALGLGTGDIVWTSPNSFAASANCALYCGAQLDFVDIDPCTFNMSIELLSDKLAFAKVANKLPKVLIIVHFAGCTLDMMAIASLAKEYKFSIIEDAAHSLGATYKDEKVGSCAYSDMTVFSFHPVKSITTAEGGAVMTNSADLDKKLKLYSKHGITRDIEQMTMPSHGPWHYQQVALGYNYRLSDLQAALGITQLAKVDDFMQKRRRLVDKYFQELADLPIQLPIAHNSHLHSWHLFMIVLKQHDRSDVYQKLHDLGIAVNVHYIPIHTHPFYQSLGFKVGDFPNSEQFYQNALTIPLYPSLTDEQQNTVINSLRKVLS